MCQINIPFSGASDDLVKRAQTQIAKTGGTFSGDAAQGQFRAQTPLGSIQGTYQIAGQQMSLSILKKPFLLSCSRIEKELQKLIR